MGWAGLPWFLLRGWELGGTLREHSVHKFDSIRVGLKLCSFSDQLGIDPWKATQKTEHVME